MRSSIVFFAVLVAVFANPTNIKPHDEEEVTEAFIWCVNKALDGGLPEAGIPDHNPLKVPRNISYDFNSSDIINGYFHASEIYLDGITVFNISNLEGHYTDDSQSEIVFEYKLYWPVLQIRGEYDTELDILGVGHEYTGTFNISLNHLTFTGIWDMTTDPKTLVNFTVTPATESVDAEIQGAGVINDAIVSAAISVGLQEFLDLEADMITGFVSPALQQRFNEQWLDANHTYRIDAIIANCQESKMTLSEFTPKVVSLATLFDWLL